MTSPKYSVIIPVYNRPEEVGELLESLNAQNRKNFEVIVVEDGSITKCKSVVEEFMPELDVSYFYKDNGGQGFTRNYGFGKARGEWLIVFDSDCLIPPNYFEAVDLYLQEHDIDAFGGPDRAHKSFSAIQKAISYSMTSFFTTGGIRGSKKHIGVFHPRSFNMGIKKKVFEETNGYILPRKGEDIEFSIRIIEHGFKTALIEEAFVYHKRRTSFKQFFNQLHFFGTARINIFRFYPRELKLVHVFPSAFFVGLLTALFSLLLIPKAGMFLLGLYLVYFSIILLDSMASTRSIRVAFLSVVASFIQLCAYGIGFIKEAAIYLTKG